MNACTFMSYLKKVNHAILFRQYKFKKDMNIQESVKIKLNLDKF